MDDIFGQEASIEDAVKAMLSAEEKDDQNTGPSDDEEEEDSDEGTNEAADEGDSDETDPDDSDQDEESEDDDDDEEESDEESEDESDEEEESDEEDDDDDDEPQEADENAQVTVTVNGEEQRVSVGELKRLAGQETALTQKAQNVAAQRKVIESQGQFLANVLQKRYEAAKANAEKYANVDLWKASQDLDEQEFNELRQAKEAAEAEVTQLEGEGEEFVKEAQEKRQALLREQAKEARKVLQDEIPEWSDELYGKIRQYAVNQGMDQGEVNEIVNPAAIQIMNKAMRYDEAQTNAKKKVTKKAKKSSKRAVKSQKDATNSKSSQAKQAKRKAAESGAIDDVVAAFEANYEG